MVFNIILNQYYWWTVTSHLVAEKLDKFLFNFAVGKWEKVKSKKAYQTVWLVSASGTFQEDCLFTYLRWANDLISTLHIECIERLIALSSSKTLRRQQPPDCAQHSTGCHIRFLVSVRVSSLVSFLCIPPATNQVVSVEVLYGRLDSLAERFARHIFGRSASSSHWLSCKRHSTLNKISQYSQFS